MRNRQLRLSFSFLWAFFGLIFTQNILFSALGNGCFFLYNFNRGETKMLNEEHLKIIKAKTQNVPLLYLWQVIDAVNVAMSEVPTGSVRNEIITAEDYD